MLNRWNFLKTGFYEGRNFTYNPLFDFSMAGEDDLIEANGRTFPVIPMDACNFVPDYFKPSDQEPFWDILYVARAVAFKKIPEFFEAIRTLYDRGHRYRVLHICPIPPYQRRDRNAVLYEVRELYDKMFSEREQDLFTLLTVDFRYPFPFDLETLTHFYRSSRIFVHFANEERRCRVAAYAWATGIPVVAGPPVGSLLPLMLRVPPYFYEVGDYSEFPDQIIRALDENPSRRQDFEEVRKHVSAGSTGEALAEHLRPFLATNGPGVQTADLSLSSLDIRLGWHHGVGDGPNSVRASLPEFIDLLLTREPEVREVVTRSPDPERELERLFPVGVGKKTSFTGTPSRRRPRSISGLRLKTLRNLRVFAVRGLMRKAASGFLKSPEVKFTPASIQSSVEEFARNLSSGAQVVDVGCGLRPYERFFSHCSYMGIDVEESGRELKDKKPDVFFDGTNVPFDANHFDAAICTEVLEHCVDPDKLVSEMYRVLKSGGLLLVTVPFMWGEHEAPYDFRRYSTYGIQQLFAGTKFRLVRLAKLTRGADAIQRLVDSEINNYNVNVKKQQAGSRLERVKERMLTRVGENVWRIQLKLWNRLYVFDRIYLDNLIIAAKE